MPLPILLDVFQVRLNWHNPNAPRDASNNLYFSDSVGTQTEANLNTDINASVTQAMWGVVSGDALVNAITVTKLDGASAGVVFNQTAAAKWTGLGVSDCVLQGCVVVSIKSTHRGPAGRGRVYLPFISETSQTNGTFVGSGYTGMQGAWDTFRASMATAGWTAYQVHNETDAHPTPWGLPAQYTVRPSVYTQRRRARR